MWFNVDQNSCLMWQAVTVGGSVRPWVFVTPVHHSMTTKTGGQAWRSSWGCVLNLPEGIGLY